MDCLYHYCSNETCFSILKGRNIRMSNIGKSNDSLELQLLFPELHREILRKYEESPFPFRYEGLDDKEAMRELIQSSERKWGDYFKTGSFTNFVVCFSEIQDCLSQWRGYADDGRGCCIGFSKEMLQEYCNNSKGVLRMEQVKYITEEERCQIISQYASNILHVLSVVRQWSVERNREEDSQIMNFGIVFTLDRLLENAFIDSLGFKSISFSEEKEWRIFLAYDAYAKSTWMPNIVDDEETSERFFNAVHFIDYRVDFRTTNDDLIPFCPIEFKEFSQNPISEIWLGPKSKIRESDIELFLYKNRYSKFSIHHSSITYR